MAAEGRPIGMSCFLLINAFAGREFGLPFGTADEARWREIPRMKLSSDRFPTRAELDLAIANMDSAEAEESVRAALKILPGIRAVRLIERGAWMEYDSAAISVIEICTALHRAGFRAGLFQDSKSGRTGKSTV